MNSDNHEGNFLFTEEGKVICLDFGRTHYWPAEHSQHQNEFTLAFALQDFEAAQNAWKNTGIVKNWDEFDFEEFWEMLRAQQAHCIAGRPMRFSAEYIQNSLLVSKTFRGGKHLRLTADTTFALVQAIGLWKILARLGVEED